MSMSMFSSWPDCKLCAVRERTALRYRDRIRGEERTEAQLDRQQQQINELTLKQARPAFARDGASASSFAARETRRRSTPSPARRQRGAARARNQGAVGRVGAGGGYLVPPEVEHAIGRRLAAIPPIRSLASVRVVSANVYKKPFMTSGPAVGWVGETDARPQTNSPVLDELNFPVMELYAMPAATPTLLDDAAVNIDEWIASEVELAFATQEGAAFVTGDGVNKPKGFLSYTTVANLVAVEQARLYRNRRGGELACVQSLRRAGRPHLFAEGGLSPERRVRDEPQDAERDPQVQGHDRPVSVAAAGAGRRAREPAHLPGDELEDMPDIGTDAFAIAFGDFIRGYLIVDRVGIRVLRDPYSTPNPMCCSTPQNVGGGVQNFEAIKLMKFAAS